jgi:phosphate-selective porin OprO and OprP
MRLAAVFLCLAMLCPRPAAAQEIRFPPPSLRIGEFRADLHVRLHFDFRALDSDPEVAPDEFDFRRFRLSLEGRIYDDLEYELDASLLDSENPWRDVFLNYRKVRPAQVQAGKFKMPFGLDQLTSEFSNNFIERSLIGTQVAPGRDKGVMVHGRVAGDRLQYRGGWFLHDGDNMQFIEDLDQNEFLGEPPVDNTIAGRVELTPWEPTRGLLRRLQFGANFTRGVVDDGLFGMRGRTVREFTFFEPMYVSGERIRLGVDALWTPGPFSVSAEYNRLTDQRNGQGFGDVDLPDVIAQGWYLAGTWALTGERKAGGIEPRHPLFQGGAGALEVVARFDELRFSSDGTGGEPPFRNPRAANILPNRDRVITLGGNWYLNQYGRVLFNAVRETIQDPVRSPLPEKTRYWTGVLRLQFAM